MTEDVWVGMSMSFSIQEENGRETGQVVINLFWSSLSFGADWNIYHIKEDNNDERNGQGPLFSSH